jgi:membrane fusion protein (multidrug efflux system)
MVTNNPISTNGRKRKKALLGTTLVFLVMFTAYGFYYIKVLSKFEETDDAYVNGNLVTVSSQVPGNVKEIHAEETQKVEAGAKLVALDPVDTDVSLSEAGARLEATVLKLRETYTSVDQYESVIRERKIQVKKAQDDLVRRLPLAKDHTIPEEEIVHSSQALEEAKAALDVAVRQKDTVQQGLGKTTLEHHPSLLAAKASYIQAWLAWRRSTIPAPVAGYVAKRNVQVGSRVTPGMPLLSIVPLDQLWVDANFKESQLQNIRIGQPVTVEADMYGGKVTYHGKVAGLAAGTGSVFSLLPAQNATGNWVKVVQRLAVRIALDPGELTGHPLRVGLSTIVNVDTHDRSGTALGTPMPAGPVYATTALDLPMQDAESAAERIIKNTLVN